jgi:hypothetical protein
MKNNSVNICLNKKTVVYLTIGLNYIFKLFR